jgi:hypothetical protein
MDQIKARLKDTSESMGIDERYGDELGKVDQGVLLLLASFGSALSGVNLPKYDPENPGISNAFNTVSGKSSETFSLDPI